MSQPKFYSQFVFFKLLVVLISIVLIILIFVKLIFDINLIYFGVLIFILSIAILIFRLVQLIYKLEMDRMNDVNQTESLMWLYQEMKPKYALPPMGVYAGTPDFYKIIISHIKEYKPKVILELGSGVSTAVISEYLQFNKLDTTHYALDHIEKYSKESKSYLKFSNSKVVYAPLKKYEIEGDSYLWYDIDKIKELSNIDLLIVDGPPEDINKLARFPALDVLHSKLSKDVVIILDDSNRKDETIIIEKWINKHGFDKIQFYTAKGTTVLKSTINNP